MTAVRVPNATAHSLDHELIAIRRQLDELTTELRRNREQREVWQELGADVGPVARQAMDRLTQELVTLEARGYPDFVAGMVAIVDRVVTSFGADDLEALGDNIVVILQTVREMTQPQIMSMLQRTASVVTVPIDEGETPSVFALLRELRDPDVRRGLGRVLHMLRTVGIDVPAGPNPDKEV